LIKLGFVPSAPEKQPDLSENTVEDSPEVVEGQLVDVIDAEPSPFLALAIPSSSFGSQGETANPVLVYLASLAPSGRRTMRGKLEVVCELLTGKRDFAQLPWHLLRYEPVAAIRARLEEKGLAPASINATLYALRVWPKPLGIWN